MRPVAISSEQALSTLARFARANEPFPTTVTLARLWRVTNKTVRTTLTRLEQEHELEIQIRADGATRYHFPKMSAFTAWSAATGTRAYWNRQKYAIQEHHNAS